MKTVYRYNSTFIEVQMAFIHILLLLGYVKLIWSCLYPILIHALAKIDTELSKEYTLKTGSGSAGNDKEKLLSLTLTYSMLIII